MIIKISKTIIKKIFKKIFSYFPLKLIKANEYESLLLENKSIKEENNYLKKSNLNYKEDFFNNLRFYDLENKQQNSLESFNVGLINPNIYSDKNKKLFPDILETVAGNTGNSYIGEFLFRSLKKYNKVVNLQNNIFIDPIPDQKQLQNLNYIVFSFQDLLKDSLSYFDKFDPFDAWIKNLKKSQAIPIVIGIGINGNDLENFPSNPLPSLINLLKLVDDMGGIICTRCTRTTFFLYKYGINNAVTTGCPSFFAFDSDPRNKVKNINPETIFDSYIGINGIFWSKYLNQKKLLPILQDEPGFLRLISDERSLAFTDIAYNLDMSMGYTNMILESIKEKRISIHGTLESASSYYDKMLFSIGTRVHGSIASFNAGTPSILTNGDLRAHSISEFFKIPYWPEYGFSNTNNKFGENLSLTDLSNFIKDHDWDEFVINRKKRANFFQNVLETYGLKFDVLEKINIRVNNLAEARLKEIDLNNSSAYKYLAKKLT